MSVQPSCLWEDHCAPAAWLQWRSLTWLSSCFKSRASALGVSWHSETGCFQWSAGLCGWPLCERSRSRLVLVRFPGVLVLSCRLVFFLYSSYKLLRLSLLNARQQVARILALGVNLLCVTFPDYIIPSIIWENNFLNLIFSLFLCYTVLNEIVPVSGRILKLKWNM
jgi:hypothetical protein